MPGWPLWKAAKIVGLSFFRMTTLSPMNSVSSMMVNFSERLLKCSESSGFSDIFQLSLITWKTERRRGPSRVAFFSLLWSSLSKKSIDRFFIWRNSESIAWMFTCSSSVLSRWNLSINAWQRVCLAKILRANLFYLEVIAQESQCPTLESSCCNGFKTFRIFGL